ncbi:ABC transporter permease subunit [Vibrio sp. SS-MA-C1-2]|uniref:ABC transporter permease n=1 Tax=Vibrio sp. SS-MA-C1-2 TaxID=2908646 RepID=UPI001F40C9C3|nr:ABC transporter permease subunit [Vibrio sp. SS-MA-C1-2]UJF18455.1 ABC transporter permease subunit [Vibrio sp. SS-MA-C1-2]
MKTLSMGTLHPQQENIVTKTLSPFAMFLIRFKREKTAIAALVILVIMLLMAIFAPLFLTYSATDVDYNNILSPPSWEHWAGTDLYGRDNFSRLIYGARISLSVGFLSVTIGVIVGSILGVMSGYYGGILDAIVMRVADILFAFPSFLLAIGIVAVLGGGIINVIIAIAIFSTPMFARIVRSQTLSVLNSQYVRAAKTMGASHTRIMFKHIIPSTISSILVYFTMRVGTSVLTAASLSFLGLGAQPPSPEWGAMLASSRDFMAVEGFAYLTLYPGLCIFLTVLSCNVLGDGIRSALDPKN